MYGECEVKCGYLSQDKAKEKYGTAIHYCLKLIGDYRIRLGKRTFKHRLEFDSLSNVFSWICSTQCFVASVSIN